MNEPTIKEIAKKADVSITTVSRALNGNYPVSAEAKSRIAKAVKELGYRPNAVARSLRNKRTNLIALVVADLTNMFFMEIAKGLEREISKNGFNLVIAGSESSIQKEHRILDSLMERRIDGLVIASCDVNADRIENCERMNTPVVLIDRPIEGVNLNQVIWDNISGACGITNELIACGHKKIGIVNVSLENRNGRERLEGFRKAFRNAGLSLNEKWVSPSNFDRDEACAWSKKILQEEDRPTGLFCANNIMLNGVLKACQELGIKIGDELSLVSFGISDFYLGPKITCMYQNSQEMGRQAGKIIFDLVNDSIRSHYTTITLDTELRRGESVGKIDGTV